MSDQPEGFKVKTSRETTGMKKFFVAGAALSFAVALNATTALADITIATVGPITGSLAALGEQYKRGAEMAVADINAAGGVNGEKLVLEIGDDACDPKQAVAVANQMASKGVKFVAGHLCSGSSIPASKVYEEEGILMISPASTNPKLTDEGGWNVHRVCGRDDAQGKVAAAFIAKNYAGKKVAVIDDKSAYGKGLADVTRDELKKANFEVALSESFTPGEKDYTALVSKMKDAGIEAIYIGGYHPEEGIIARQMGEQGLKAQIISGDSMNNVEFWTIAGNAGEGLLFTFAPEPRNIPEAKEVVEKFKAAGYDPEGYTLYTYAAIQAYAQAANAIKDTDNKKIAEWLRAGNDLKTVLGTLKMDKKGDLQEAKYVWYRFSNGKYAEDPSLQ
jgi:branched-chain amino acid transport system substrate-binding protein